MSIREVYNLWNIALAILLRVTRDNDGVVVFATANAFVKIEKLSCHSTLTILKVDNLVNTITKWSVFTEQCRDDPLQYPSSKHFMRLLKILH